MLYYLSGNGVFVLFLVGVMIMKTVIFNNISYKFNPKGAIFKENTIYLYPKGII